MLLKLKAGFDLQKEVVLEILRIPSGVFLLATRFMWKIVQHLSDKQQYKLDMLLSDKGSAPLTSSREFKWYVSKPELKTTSHCRQESEIPDKDKIYIHATGLEFLAGLCFTPEQMLPM